MVSSSFVYSMVLDTALDLPAEGRGAIEAVRLACLLVVGGLAALLLMRRLLSKLDDALGDALERRRQGQGGTAAPDSRLARVRRTHGIWRGRPSGGGHIPEG